MNPGIDPATEPGYGFGYAIGVMVPIVVVVIVLSLAVWGMRHVIIGSVLVRGVRVAERSRQQQ